jgi:hypothetical protein
MTTSRDDAAAKAHAGLTTPEDVLRVASVFKLLAALTSLLDRELRAAVPNPLLITGGFAIGRDS